MIIRKIRYQINIASISHFILSGFCAKKSFHPFNFFDVKQVRNYPENDGILQLPTHQLHQNIVDFLRNLICVAAFLIPAIYQHFHFR